MSDQHSKHMLGCYGNYIVRTPNLDRLATEGIQFNNAYCASPVCCPSRMSFLTGRTPSNNSVWNNNRVLNSAIPTWAHVLSIAGYGTSLLGRMHFEGHEQYHGFEQRPIGEMFAVHPGGFNGEKYPSGQNRRVMELSGTGTTTYPRKGIHACTTGYREKEQLPKGGRADQAKGQQKKDPHIVPRTHIREKYS